MPNTPPAFDQRVRRLDELWDDMTLVKWRGDDGFDQDDPDDDLQFPERVLYLNPDVERWMTTLPEIVEPGAPGPEPGTTLRRQAMLLMDDFVFGPDMLNPNWPRVKDIHYMSLGIRELRSSSLRLFGAFHDARTFIVGAGRIKAEMKVPPPGWTGSPFGAMRENYRRAAAEAAAFIDGLAIRPPKIDKRPVHELV